MVDWGSGEAAFNGLNVVVGQKLLSEDGALRLVKGTKAMALGYDPNGNMTSRVVEGLGYVATYDAENRLVEVRKSGGLVASFVYDGDGKRVKGEVGEWRRCTLGITTSGRGAWGR